jgi:hypothetical protein
MKQLKQNGIKEKTASVKYFLQKIKDPAATSPAKPPQI